MVTVTTRDSPLLVWVTFFIPRKGDSWLHELGNYQHLDVSNVTLIGRSVEFKTCHGTCRYEKQAETMAFQVDSSRSMTLLEVKRTPG